MNMICSKLKTNNYQHMYVISYIFVQITDMRAVIKKVEKQKDEELNYTIMKKKKLQDEIDRYQAALKVVHNKNNTMYADMIAFKDINSNNN